MFKYSARLIVVLVISSVFLLCSGCGQLVTITKSEHGDYHAQFNSGVEIDIFDSAGFQLKTGMVVQVERYTNKGGYDSWRVVSVVSMPK